MKHLIALPLCLAALSLSACGLRGDLERPDPMWGNPNEPETPPAVEEPQQEAALRQRSEPEPEPTTSYRDPETGEIVWIENENGGDKPLAKPTTPIESGGLPPVEE
ncbi:LPS translocon maturation chaperone LptM [Ponticaulis profundi]|uniref:Lipoprotein n=1 Tax=Ponticaulis profundi TaxID=2665222 RepID=A0ABW1S8G8_9PROT